MRGLRGDSSEGISVRDCPQGSPEEIGSWEGQPPSPWGLVRGILHGIVAVVTATAHSHVPPSLTNSAAPVHHAALHSGQPRCRVVPRSAARGAQPPP